MKPLIRAFILVLLTLIYLQTMAQGTIQLRSENIFQKNGFGNVHVNAIAQDRFGYIWLGTSEGLYKFDGYNLSSKQLNNNGKVFLNKNISNLFIDTKQNLWILNSENGLLRYNILNHKVTNFTSDRKNNNSLCNNNVVQMLQDNNGAYWIATTNGLDKLELRTNEKGVESYQFTHFTNTNENTIPSNHVKCILLENNFIWIGTDEGLCKLETKTNQIIQHEEINVNNQKRSAISTITINNQTHDVWIGTADNGVWVLSKNVLGQMLFTQFIKPSVYFNRELSSLLFDNNFNIWIGVVNGNVIKFNMKNQSIEEVDMQTAGGQNVNLMFRDAMGIIWIAHENGLNKIFDKKKFSNIDLHKEPFNFKDNTNVYAILEDKTGNIWIGTDNNGLIKYSSNRHELVRYSVKADKVHKINSNEVYAITENKLMIYVGTRKGLNAINKLTGEVVSVPEQKANLDINTLSADVNGNIWIGLMNNGFCWLDYTNWQFNCFKDNELINNKARNNDVKFIYPTKEGMVYLATDSGLKKFNPITQTFIRYRYDRNQPNSITSNTVTSIYEDKNGMVWVGTYNGGFNKFDPKKETFTRIPCRFMNENTEVYSILSDGKNNLWLSTNVGILKYEVSNGNFLLFDKTDGTISNEYNAGAFYKNNKGEIYYGGVNGITYFNPDSISNYKSDFRLAFNSITANNQFLPFEYDSLYNPSIVLQPEQYNFTVDFTAINFISSDKIQYAYKLIGSDKDWVYTGNRHFTIFNNLSPGTYKLKFKASIVEGVWKESDYTLTINIKPPFWRTWWFYTLVALAVFALVYYLIRLRVQYSARIKEEEVARQSNKMKQQFLANMSHEIRTPMNSVIGFTELLSQTKLNQEQSNYLSAIKSSAENLLVIIDDILDFSKIDAGKVDLQKSNVPIQKIIDKVHSTLYLKAKEKNLKFVIEKLSDVPEVIYCDEVRLYQILTNLLNNAIKFTHDGKVGLQIMKIEDQSTVVKLQFKIYDTGIGIEKDKISTVFNSFTQANMDTTKKYGGTGLGLSITKQLVDLFNGRIYLESEVGEGTTFHVEIPFEKVEDSFSVVHKKESGIIPKIYKNGKLALGIESETEIEQNERIGDITNAKAESFDFTKPSILLAEDNPFNQLLAKTVLNKYFPDAILTIANNGKQVLDYFSEGKKFDIILMDVQMPEMDGFEATIKIRENKANDIIPIIACTAGVTPPEVQQCFESGMDDFLAKPFQPNDLVNKINFHIQKSKAKLVK